MKTILALIAAVAMIFCAMPAHATLWSFDSILLDGLQETPPVATPGTGTATATLDDVTNQFDLMGTFSNLIGTTNNAHVHGPDAPPGTPAGVLFGINFDFGVTSGNFSFSGVITAAQTSEILAGETYINIHSTFRPGGEIRGQIANPIPEPTTLAMLAMGVGGMLALRRRGR
jgi:hypothetical protein